MVFVCDLPYQISASFSAEVQILSSASTYSVDFHQSINFLQSLENSIVPSIVSRQGGDVRLILSGNALVPFNLVDDALQVNLGASNIAMSQPQQSGSIFSAVLSIPKLALSDISVPIVTVKTSFGLALSSIQISVEPDLSATAKLRDSGAGIRITFSHATNEADIRNDEKSCLLYFKQESVLLMGAFSTCLWSSDSEMLISFGLMPTVQVGAYLHFRPDSPIKSISGASVLVDSKLIVEQSEMPLSVVAYLQGPGTIGSCDTATYEAKTMPVTFVQSSKWSSSDPLLETCLLKENHSTVLLRESCLTSTGSYITLRVALLLSNGQTLHAERNLYVSQLDVPTLQIQAPRTTFYVSDNLKFVSNLKFSSCNSSSKGIVFRWKLTRFSGQLLLGASFEQHGAFFILPPRTLNPDTYLLKLTALSPDWAVYSSAEMPSAITAAFLSLVVAPFTAGVEHGVVVAGRAQ